MKARSIAGSARTGCLFAMLVGLWGCSIRGSSDASTGVPTPTASATPSVCAPDLGPEGTERAREALFAVRLALAEGLSLTKALEAVFGVRISAMTTNDRADALRVLAGLDLCPRQSVEVRDDIPPLIRRIAEQGRPDRSEGATRPSPPPP